MAEPRTCPSGRTAASPSRRATRISLSRDATICRSAFTVCSSSRRVLTSAWPSPWGPRRRPWMSPRVATMMRP